MTSYLIFFIAYGHVFEDLLSERNIDFKMEPFYAWYLAMCRHKSQYNFYLVHNNFISEFKNLIFGPCTSRLSLKSTTFLSGKGVFESSEEFTIIRLLGCEEKNFLLPLLYQTNFLLRKCEDSIKPGPISSMRGEKSNS
jgi:hypothetical protein